MMHFKLLVLAFITLTHTLYAQPDNDDCNSIIDLGTAPYDCSDAVVYSNIRATTSNIGTGNTPSCFNGGTPQRDVWFSFTTTPAVDAYTFTVVGTDAGGTSPLRNPQIALYRGSCQLDGLGELGCATAPNGQTSVSLEASGLSSGITYYLRVNDYSATASPNSGGFQLCISETSSTFNMGERDGSTACTGTLFDSGGASEMYDSNENNTFTICPQSFHQCILLDVKSFASEQNFDNLRVYAGEEQRSENLIARLTGVVAAEGFQIQTDSECVTLVFNSDLLIADDGFQIDWSCTAASCSGSTTENPTVIDNIPFSESASTCSAGATFINSPCTDDVFIAGPEVVYAYETTGGSCLQIELSGARAQTGIAVFDGDPTVSGSACVASTTGSLLLNVDVTTAGTYYIVVANADGCTDYSIDIEDTPCMLNASLENAICQPINSCVNEQGTPTQLIFERGFQDIEISAQNGGCWSGTGFNPSFLWFSVQTAAAGDFGFIANSPDTPSDIDFNVWGPFSPSAICEDPDIVRNTVQFQSPIRSSFSSKPAATGLANINPVTGEAVTDTYDCRNDTGTIVTETDGDDFVRTIDAQADEVYIVLLNDWGGQIQSSGMLMDFSPSSPGLLQLENAEVRSTALAICAGDEAQIVVESTSDQIEWLNNTETLSCDDCLDPVATPTVSTTYRAAITNACSIDTLSVTVQVFMLDVGADEVTVCRGETFVINAGEEYPNANYTWTVDEGIELSCTNCPSPVVNTPNAGTFEISVRLDAPDCPMTDQLTVTVLSQEAAEYDIKPNQQICIGDELDLMNNAPDDQAYIWSSEPVGFTSSQPNPTVAPTQNTRYFVSISNGICPFPSMDSILVEASTPPVIEVSEDITVCEGDTFTLSNIVAAFGVDYMWTGPAGITDSSDPQTTIVASNSGTYTLVADRNGCERSASVEVTVVPIGLTLMPMDTALLCVGDTIDLIANPTPAGNPIVYMPQDSTFDPIPSGGIRAYPTDNTTYYFRTTSNGCIAEDSIVVKVDSLPTDLVIMPTDTTICEGMMVELISTTYEPADFPGIEFIWTPTIGALTPDSLFNLVVSPTDTVTYKRININGACVDTSTAVVNVNPIPMLRITPDNPIVCPGESVALTTTVLDETITISSYMWEPPVGLSCTDCPNPTASPSQTTTYNLMVTTEDDCPAMGQVTISVTGDGNYQFPNLTEPICPGDVIVLNQAAADERLSYTWTTEDGSFSSNEAAPAVSPLQTTTYTLTLSDGVCSPITDQVTIEVAQDNMIVIDGDTNGCSGDLLQLNAQNLLPSGSITWVDATANDVSTNNPYTVNTNLIGERVITYNYESRCGVQTGEVLIRVGASFEIDSIQNSTSDTVLVGTDINLRVFFPEEIETENVEWGTGGCDNFTPLEEDSENMADGIFADLRPLQSETYAVKVTAIGGCTRCEEIDINVVVPTIVIPNAFTPNGDGENDFFYPASIGLAEGIGNAEILTFQVYNRWGQLVYNNEDPQRGWDGNYNGSPAPADMYVYKISIRMSDGQVVDYPRSADELSPEERNVPQTITLLR